MSQRRRVLVFSILLMTLMALSVTAVTITFLYRTAITERTAQLEEATGMHARLIEAMARFSSTHVRDDHPAGCCGSIGKATLNQLADAHERTAGFGKTGEFVLACRNGDRISFLLPFRHSDGGEPEPVPWDSSFAEPMRLALSGKSGTIIALDYRGEEVLAAYEHLDLLDFGIVAKIDTAEIREPFVIAGAAAAAVALLFMGIGAWLVLKICDPVLDKLEESEARHRGILEAAAEAIITIDEKGRVGSYNAAAERMFGYLAAEVVGKNINILMPSPHREEHDGYLQRYRRSGQRRIMNMRRELLGRRKNGATFPMDLFVSELQTDQGRIFTGIVQDTTDRKRSEAALSWRAKQAELLHRTTLMVQQAEGIEKTLQGAVDLICEGTGWPVGHAYRLADDDSEKLLPTTIWHIDDAEAVANFRQITGKTIFKIGVGLPGRTLASGMPEWIVNVQLDDNFPRARACQDIGVKGAFAFPMRVEGKTMAVLEFFSADEMAPDEGLLLLLGNIGDELGRSTERKLASRERRRSAEILESKNEALEAQKEELELRRQELESLNEHLQAAQDQAVAATRAKSEFLANMSHEIRTPMTAILGFTDILLDPQADASDWADAARTIHRNGEALLVLINDILDLSKIEAGRLELEKRSCDLSGMLRDIHALMKVRADAKRLDFRVTADGPIPEKIETDPMRLRQILINLIGNAIKFTEAGSVRVVARLVPGDRKDSLCAGEDRENLCRSVIHFDVIDTGVGMSEEAVRHIFRPFAQADSSTTRKFGGTGLGLAISRRLVETLGGEIAVESELGRGSTFGFQIDIGALAGVKMIEFQKSGNDDTPEKVEAKPACAPESRLNCRILLAEDSPDSQRLIVAILTKAGAEVTAVDNGKAAVDRALAAEHGNRQDDPTKPFDVILMDMQMPVMDGYEATATLRAKGYDRPIIALTAHAMAGDREKCLQAGCTSYETKPISKSKLIQTIVENTKPQKVAT